MNRLGYVIVIAAGVVIGIVANPLIGVTMAGFGVLRMKYPGK